MARVYIETSFFSACVSKRLDPKSSGWRLTSREWWKTQASRHELFIAAEVVRELQNPGFSEREAALRMIRSLNLLEHTPEAIDLAEVLVAEKVMPAPAIAGDALHVATAAVHRMDYILSWNVRHLANPNKRMHLAVICMRLNLSAPQLVTPDLLWEVSDG